MLENIIVLKCVSVIRNDLNMITIFHGLSKMIGQLSATAKLWKEMAKRKVKICKIITKNLKSFLIHLYYQNDNILKHFHLFFGHFSKSGCPGQLGKHF